MNDNPIPTPDLPFSNEVIEYCAKRLGALRIRPDREWLQTDGLSILDYVSGAEHEKMIFEARRKIPRTSAFWEISEFYRFAMPVALFDVVNGPMDRFEHFELLYVRLLGEEARPWLPSLYLAVASSPALIPDCRKKYVARFNVNRLGIRTGSV